MIKEFAKIFGEPGKVRETMTRSLLLTLCLALVGCGESTESKRNRATSQVNVLAEKFSEKIGDDGYFVRQTEVEDLDPWGSKLVVKYERHGARETLTVRSNGEDGLPLTKDDIAARYHLDSEKAREALHKDLQRTVEGYSMAAARGLTKGAFDSVKEAMKK
jgi:hypothetical protein